MQDSTAVFMGKRSPTNSTSCHFALADEQIHCAIGDVDSHDVAIFNKCDRATIDGLGCNVANT